MALILATGSNLGDRVAHLEWARMRLSEEWNLIAQSRVYLSAAVGYTEQAEFANQVLQFALPWERPELVMEKILQIELEAGRVRDVHQGPRTLDIDIVFWGLEKISRPNLIVPHPRWHERSFVVRPLMELPFFHAIEKCFTISSSFGTEATPLSN